MLYLYFVLGLFFLAYGGDTLVKGAVGVARKLNVSPLVVGIVLVGFGTSTPELIASILAVFQTPPSPAIAVGNVVGSNICNILLVLGVTALIAPVKIEMKSFARDSLFLGLSTVALFVAAMLGGLNFFGGAVLVMMLFAYVAYCYVSERKDKKAIKQMQAEQEQTAPLKHSTFVYVMIAVLGMMMTMLGAKALVYSAVAFARQWGISETVIGLTVVAVGTSLPELASSIAAALKKQNELAYGNIVGSNIYNALFILGAVALLTPYQFPSDIWPSLTIMAMTTLWLIVLGIYKQISRLMGLLFLMAYVGYVVCLML